jgi:hypothetical protein
VQKRNGDNANAEKKKWLRRSADEHLPPVNLRRQGLVDLISRNALESVPLKIAG